MTKDVLFEKLDGNGGALGLITLNRPQTLNALNHGMMLAIEEHLKLWGIDDSVKAVLIRAVEGRAFCAGGDLRNVYDNGREKDLSGFFRDEYRMNALLHHFSKPYIAFLDGITMGGGVGISVHGSHRIATENLLFAMPETGIGFFPDVGASYFLSHLPNNFGIYLGLTGARLQAADCCYLGLATHFVCADKLNLLQQALLDNIVDDVTDIILQFVSKPDVSKLEAIVDQVKQHFSNNSVEAIVASLESDNSDWALGTLKHLNQKSPTSLKVAFEQMKRGAELSFDDCMAMELTLVKNFLKSHDFYEGIRAVLIEKDNQAKWSPDCLNDVKQEIINAYFN